jgi:hypothetical protein
MTYKEDVIQGFMNTYYNIINVISNDIPDYKIILKNYYKKNIKY